MSRQSAHQWHSTNYASAEAKNLQHQPKKAWVDNPFGTVAMKDYQKTTNSTTRNEPSLLCLRNDHDWTKGGPRSQYNQNVKRSLIKEITILTNKKTLSEKEQIQKRKITVSLEDRLPGLAIDNDPCC